MQTRGKTYSKFSRACHGETNASALFDSVTRSGKVQKKGCLLNENEGRETRKTRAQKKKAKEKITREKLPPVTSENEASSDYNESSTFMIFTDDLIDNLKKKKTENSGHTRKTTKPLRNIVNNKEGSGSKRNTWNKFGNSCDGRVVEGEIEPVKNTRKSRPKKNKLTTNVSQAKGAKKMPLKYPHNSDGDRNINNLVYKDLNASMEGARDEKGSLPCQFRLGDSSPDLCIEEPNRKSLGEDSLLAGDDSFSTDYDEISTPSAQSKESSKYTYTFVSTYTQGASSQSHSTTTTKSVNSPHVPMKKHSQLNSTKCADKLNINELDFPISPIQDFFETTPIKPPGTRVHRIPRMRRNKLVCIEESIVHPPPKCSTMLFTPEKPGCHLEFPCSLTHIEKLNPSTPCNGTKLESVEDVKSCFRSPEGSPKKPKLCIDKVERSKKSKAEEKNVARRGNKDNTVDFQFVNGDGGEIEVNPKALNGYSKPAEKFVQEADGSAKKGTPLLKSFKRLSSCISSSRSDKAKGSRRVSFVDENQNHLSNRVSSQHINNEVCATPVDSPVEINNSFQKCTPYLNTKNETDKPIHQVSSAQNARTLILDSDVEDDQIFVNLQKHSNEMGLQGLDMCCVFRLCRRYRRVKFPANRTMGEKLTQ